MLQYLTRQEIQQLKAERVEEVRAMALEMTTEKYTGVVFDLLTRESARLSSEAWSELLNSLLQASENGDLPLLDDAVDAVVAAERHNP